MKNNGEVNAFDSRILQSEEGQNQSNKVLFCRKFQRGECSFVEPHLIVFKGKNVIVQHISAACWLKEQQKCFHAEKSDKCPFSTEIAASLHS